MTESSLISIILPVYNGERYLKQAIQSCLNQTYNNLELIIVDDASTDNSLTIAREFENNDDRIKIYFNEKNLSLPGSLNIGHKHAKGLFITWTSDDNILKPDFLSSLYMSLIQENCDVVFSNYDILWADGILKRQHITGPLPNLLFGNIIGASFLYKRKVFEKLSGYAENLFLVEDYHFFLRASLNFNFYHLDKNLYQYRLHQNSLTGKIQRNKKYKEKFENSLIVMFKDLEINLKDETIQLLIDLYFKNPIKIEKFLRYRKVIKKDILNFEKSLINSNDIFALDHFYFLIRNNWIENINELTVKNLLLVILKDKKLLFSVKQNRNTTLKLILCCLSPKLSKVEK